jgi:hypothetical protein
VPSDVVGCTVRIRAGRGSSAHSRLSSVSSGRGRDRDGRWPGLRSDSARPGSAFAGRICRPRGRRAPSTSRSPLRDAGDAAGSQRTGQARHRHLRRDSSYRDSRVGRLMAGPPIWDAGQGRQSFAFRLPGHRFCRTVQRRSPWNLVDILPHPLYSLVVRVYWSGSRRAGRDRACVGSCHAVVDLQAVPPRRDLWDVSQVSLVRGPRSLRR